MNITAKQKKALLALAENTIRERLSLATHLITLSDDFFQIKSGVFVTLHKHNQLRGCIGSLSAQQTIVDGVRGHAINAAFQDHRFPPVSADELDDITIEISILTKPEPLEFIDASDVLKKLRVGTHGVTLYSGNHSATFLPQVWEQLPDPQEFLRHLSLKAGLNSSGWQEKGVKIDIYTVIKF